MQLIRLSFMWVRNNFINNKYIVVIMRTVVKIILLNDKGEFLLNLRDKDHDNPGFWALLGGGVDKGETHEYALIREIREEISYQLRDFKKIHEEITPEGRRIFFLGRIDVPIRELNLNEGEDLKFFSADEIKNLKINPLQRKVIEMCIK